MVISNPNLFLLLFDNVSSPGCVENGYAIVFSQLHLLWILSIARQQQNLMKVELRVF